MRSLLIAVFMIGASLVFAQQLNQGILLQDQTGGNTIAETGINFYSTLIENDPSDVKSLLLRSQLYSSLDLNEKARLDYNRAMYINPYGRLYLTSDERSSFFENRTFQFGLFSDQLSDPFGKSFVLEDEYVRFFKQLDNQDSAAFLLESSLMALIDEDIEMANFYLESIEPVSRNSAMYFDLQGLLQMKVGNTQDAVSSFTKAISIDPTFTIAYHNRAVANKHLGRYDLSERDFDSALMQRADLAKVNFGKAKLLELKKDLSGAKTYYKDALKLENEYYQARLNYSVLLKASGDYTSSLLEINSVISDNPEVFENYYVRGGLYFIYGEYSNAVEDFDIYLSMFEDDADARFYRGLSDVLQGNTLRGCEDMSLAIQDGHTKYADIFMYMCQE